MTSSKELVSMNKGIEELDDMFADLPPLDPFELKKEEVSTQLAALMVHCKLNRSTMIDRLGWKKSRLSQVLSGRANLTVKTIFEFSSVLGLDFDLVFRKKCDDRANQIWEGQFVTQAPLLETEAKQQSVFKAVIKPLSEVAREIAAGEGQAYYITSIQHTDHSFFPVIEVNRPSSPVSANAYLIPSFTSPTALKNFIQDLPLNHEYA